MHASSFPYPRNTFIIANSVSRGTFSVIGCTVYSGVLPPFLVRETIISWFSKDVKFRNIFHRVFGTRSDAPLILNANIIDPSAGSGVKLF